MADPVGSLDAPRTVANDAARSVGRAHRYLLPERVSISWGLMAGLAFICGLGELIHFDAIGKLYLPELLLPPLALLMLRHRTLGTTLSLPLFRVFVATGLLMLLGYIASDLVAGTMPAQYLRGWGRVALLVFDFTAVMLLVARDRQNLWWLALGFGVGGTAYLLAHHVPFHRWKIGYGDQLVFVVLTASSLLRRRWCALSIGAFGTLSVAMDYRSLGAACVLTAAIIWVRSEHFRASRKDPHRAMKLALGAVLASAVIAVALFSSNREHAVRRDYSDVGRISRLVVAIKAVAASPILGYGSWTRNEKYAQEIQAERRKLGLEHRGPYNPHPELFRPHSEVLQAWVEGGVLGASFFLVYLVQLVKMSIWAASRRRLDRLTPLLLYLMIIGLWGVLESPFGGSARLQIALSVGALFVCAWERTAARRRWAISASMKKLKFH